MKLCDLPANSGVDIEASSPKNVDLGTLDLSSTALKDWNGPAWYKIKPRLNYKTGPMCDFPTTIDPENWKAVTSEDQRGHDERQAIRGQLRRTYWSKMYHPINHKYFQMATSNIAVTRLEFAKTGWYIKEVGQLGGKLGILSFLITVAAPATLFFFCYKHHGIRWPNYNKSIVDN